MIKLKYKEIIESNDYDSQKLYLIEKINDNYGIFVYDSKIVFVTESSDEEPNYIETEYVSFKEHIFMNNAINHPSFEKGFYDILIFNGDINSECFDSFYRLCSTFPLSYTSMSFKEFFYDLIELLSMPSEKKHQNLIGLMGELFLIKTVFESKNIDLANFWHISGQSADKYDFVLSNKNIEVKTTSSDSRIFSIKHRQIFNDKNNYICLVKIMPDNSGISLNRLIKFFLSNPIFSSNIKFMFELEKEINRTNRSQRDNCFALENIDFFSNKKLVTIGDIPDCISKIEYSYDFSNLYGIKLGEFDFGL